MEYLFSDKVRGLKPSAIREIFKSLSDPSVISFAAGNPSPDSFPQAQLREITARIFADKALCERALQYNITEGYPPLRELCAARLHQKFGVGKDFDDLIITSGGQQGLDLACKALFNEGDTMLCEEPSFIGALNAFRAAGVRLKGIPLCDDGLDLALLEAALQREKRVRALYLIPTFQNPTGLCTSLAKRRQILKLAEQYGILIFEDNPYGELRFAGEDVPTLKSMDEEGRVLYFGSFSKILSAGMRVGFLCAPKPIVQKIVVLKQVNDVHTNTFFQMVCADYMQTCDLDAHIAEIRALYRAKCALMLDCLDRDVGALIAYTRPQGGIFIWCKTVSGAPSKGIVRACMERKLAVVPGEAFLCDEARESDGFRLNFSMPSDEDIRRGTAILAHALIAAQPT